MAAQYTLENYYDSTTIINSLLEIKHLDLAHSLSLSIIHWIMKVNAI